MRNGWGSLILLLLIGSASIEEISDRTRLLFLEMEQETKEVLQRSISILHMKKGVAIRKISYWFICLRVRSRSVVQSSA